jgi:dienelactone hydrolase
VKFLEHGFSGGVKEAVMKNAIYILSLLLFLVGNSAAQIAGNDSNISTEPFKIEAAPQKGFAYPYYLYVPPELREATVRKQRQTILVLPNNTGALDDALEVHEADVKKRMAMSREVASVLRVMVLMPVFPRPKTDWRIYTHALDRDALVTDKKEYRRFDLQLIAMIDDARARLAKENLKFDKRVLLNGFSAMGMFANRFMFLHPERVKAAAIGSPGGWAIAPAPVFKEKTLRYPIGTGDFKTVSGTEFDLKKVRKVPLFIFLGDQDDNDSVVFGDAYDEEDKNLIFELFGKTPVERWTISKSLYEQSKLNAEFRLYPNVKHTVTPEMRSDIRAFLAKHK